MLTQTIANRVIDRALGLGADFCEIFAEDRRETTIKYEKQQCTNASRTNIYGAGIYLLQGCSSVYVYTSDLTENGLMKLLDKAAPFLKAGKGGTPITFRQQSVLEPNPVREYPGSVALSKKVELLSQTDRAVQSAIQSRYFAEYTYFDMDQNVVIASSDGTWAQDRRVTSRIRNRFTVSNGVESAGNFVDFTRPMGFEAFRDNRQIPQFIRQVREREESLTAEKAPRGRFPVVFEGGACVGTFFHEACGHQLETNNMRCETAYFRDKLGKQVASSKVTLIDDGTLPGQYGSSKFDDEGMPRQRNVLIENGILKSFLVDRLGARQFGVKRTGCSLPEGRKGWNAHHLSAAKRIRAQPRPGISRQRCSFQKGGAAVPDGPGGAKRHPIPLFRGVYLF